MIWTQSKGNQSVNAYPRTLSWIAVSFGGLALFMAFGCWVLVSNPVGSTVRGYFVTVDNPERLGVDTLPSSNLPVDFPQVDNVDKVVSGESNSQVHTSQSTSSLPSDTILKELGTVTETTEPEDQVEVPVVSTGSSTRDDNLEAVDENISRESNPQVPISSSSSSNVSDTEEADKDPAISGPVLSSGLPVGDDVKDASLLSNTTDDIQSGDPLGTKDIGAASFGSNTGDAPPSYASGGNSGCDLYQGKWIYDSRGPLYMSDACPVLTGMQNCQGNGRPDKDYENWRWQPEQCDLPRFDARKFLELMRGKTIAFIGDSVARNQMESLLCILWQVEVPKNRGNKRMQRYYFKSTSTMVVRIWSSWLVKQTTEPAEFAPGVVKLHLDAPDDNIMTNCLNFDVIVLSSGHWFAKQSVYLLNNETVGGQLWWPDKSQPMKVNNVKAFGISVETILTSLAMHPNYTGLTIVRSFSPDHYEGGAWNTGGSCTGKTKPLEAKELVENGFTNEMHEKQVAGFDQAMKKAMNGSKTRLMDITRIFGYRHDGHPGPYRNKDPNKLTKRGPDGKPPPQDCLHWCMPGPIDTWNELVLELIRREFEHTTSSSV